VTGTVPVAAPTSLPLDGLLLDAKLSIPQPRAGLVSRAGLVGGARSATQRFVAVSAPAGYGKSSLLAEWAASEDRSVAWVALDRFDDNPIGLLILLASAFGRACGLDQALVDDMRVNVAAALGRAAPRLATALRTTNQPFVFLIDDLHALSSPACQDVLSVVLTGVPAGSQFVSASRSEQPHVASLRPADDVLEIGPQELALDSEGARHVFESAHVAVAPELVEAVTARTEGWPVGVHLAALIARDGGIPLVIEGDDRFVADYLYRESFSALSPETQEFLRRTAVLEQMSEGLCRAVTGDTTAGARLRELERTNVFLIPQDRKRTWYRYHGLYREFLLGELRRTEPDLIAHLHRRAAEWYEASDSPARAVEHLLQTSDVDHTVELIDEILLSQFQAGGMATLHRWLTTLGERTIMTYPPLGVLAGWVAVLSGEAVEAERWAAFLETASFDGAPKDGSASFASGWAMLRSLMCLDGPARMMADAEVGFAEEPSWSMWRDQAVYLAGEAELLLGNVDDADSHFAEAVALAERTGNADVFILGNTQRAMTYMSRGKWDQAAALVDIARAAIQTHHLEDYAMSVMTYAASARLAIHAGDIKRANRELTGAMRARPSCTYVIPTLAVRLRIHLATSYWSLGDAATARYLLREIEDILLRRPQLGALLEQFHTLRELVTSSPSGAQGGPPLTSAELRLLPYLQTHLTIPEIGARLFVSRNTVSSEVGSIYRKLGVSSRSEAVEIATTIGLLGA
jgi:LuxR family maltose regulon positive regulatory protein